MDSSLPTLLTIEDVAKSLTVSTRTVRRLIRLGKLKAKRISYRIVRIRPIDLEEYLQK